MDDESLGAANVCWSIFKSKRIVGGPDGKKVCELLLAKGADINCTSTTAVLTPLAHAGTATRQSLLTTLHLTFPFLSVSATVVKDNVEVAETLLQCGADPNWSALGEANLLCIAQKLHRHRFALNLLTLSLWKCRAGSLQWMFTEWWTCYRSSSDTRVHEDDVLLSARAHKRTEMKTKSQQDVKEKRNEKEMNDPAEEMKRAPVGLRGVATPHLAPSLGRSSSKSSPAQSAATLLAAPSSFSLMSVSAFALTPSSALLPAAPHSTLAPVPSLPLSTSPLPSSFSSSSLLHSIEEKSLHARRSGALQTIPTRCQLIKDTNAPSDERGQPLLVRLSSASPPLQSLRQPTDLYCATTVPSEDQDGGRSVQQARRALR